MFAIVSFQYINHWNMESLHSSGSQLVGRINNWLRTVDKLFFYYSDTGIFLWTHFPWPLGWFRQKFKRKTGQSQNQIEGLSDWAHGCLKHHTIWLKQWAPHCVDLFNFCTFVATRFRSSALFVPATFCTWLFLLIFCQRGMAWADTWSLKVWNVLLRESMAVCSPVLANRLMTQLYQYSTQFSIFAT